MCFIVHTRVGDDPANTGALFISINQTCKDQGEYTPEGLGNMGFQHAEAREGEHWELSWHFPVVLMTQFLSRMLPVYAGERRSICLMKWGSISYR